MANNEQIDLLKQGAQAWNAWRAEQTEATALNCRSDQDRSPEIGAREVRAGEIRALHADVP